MLADISEHLKIENGIDPQFLREVIGGGHDWALDWELAGVLSQRSDTDEDVRYTSDILDMWSFIEFRTMNSMRLEGRGLKLRLALEEKSHDFPVSMGILSPSILAPRSFS